VSCVGSNAAGSLGKSRRINLRGEAERGRLKKETAAAQSIRKVTKLTRKREREREREKSERGNDAHVPQEEEGKRKRRDTHSAKENPKPASSE